MQEDEVSFVIIGKPRTVLTNTKINDLPIEIVITKINTPLRQGDSTRVT